MIWIYTLQNNLLTAKRKDNKVAAVWKLDLKGHKPALEGTEETL